jgi:uncharacterized delta-60 repeat protein
MTSRVALLAGLGFPYLALAFGGGCTGDDPALCGAECQASPDGGADGAAGAAFEIASRPSVALVQGESVEIEITVTRSAFDGPITLAVSGLPEGVSAPSVVVLAGASSAKLTLSSLASVKQGVSAIVVGASDADGKLRRDLPVSLLVRGAAGTLDTTFATAGKLVTDVGATGIGVRSVVVQGDGRVLVAGSSDNDFVAVRLDPAGTIDPTYGTAGSASVDLRNGGVASVDYAEGIALAPTGEALLAGYRTSAADSSYGLARLGLDGKLDARFDTDGYATPSFPLAGANNQLAFGVAMQPDGRAVLAATVLENGAAATKSVIARFKANGAPDDSFGIAASGFFYAHSNAAEPNDTCEAIAIGGDGAIVAACSADDGGAHPVALRLTKSGQADTTFGPQNGFSPVPLVGATAHSIHVLPDGRVLMTGDTADGKAFIVRFDAKGQLDSSFAPGGTVTIDVGTKITGVRSFLDASGRLVLAGATVAMVNDPHDLVVARVTSDGKLDATFAKTGFVVTKLGAVATAGNVRVTQAPDGRIVAVTNFEAAPPKLVALRLWP